MPPAGRDEEDLAGSTDPFEHLTSLTYIRSLRSVRRLGLCIIRHEPFYNTLHQYFVRGEERGRTS